MVATIRSPDIKPFSADGFFVQTTPKGGYENEIGCHNAVSRRNVGFFWFDPTPDTDLIPAYVKQSVVSFMNWRCHADIIEKQLPPAT